MSVTVQNIEDMLGSPLYNNLLAGWGSTSLTPTQDLIDEATTWVKGVFEGMNNIDAYTESGNQDKIDLAIIYMTSSLLWKRNQNPDKQEDEFKLALEYLSSILGNKIYNYLDGEEPSQSTSSFAFALYHDGGVADVD